MDNLTFSLSVQQAELILAALGKLPFETVASLVQTIRNQAEQQMQPEPEQPSADEEEPE